MCHKSMAHPHIYFSLRLNIFSLKAKYIFFQACKSAGTPIFSFIFYLPNQASGLSLAVSLRSWNWRMLSEPTAPNAWRVLTFCPL